MSGSHGRSDLGDGVARRSVLECLAKADRPLGALDIAHETHLSTLVVIPVLGELAEEGLAARECHAKRAGDRNPTWAYVVTPRGSRAVGRASRPTG